MSACSGSLPVANALGAGSITMATFGIGAPDAMQTSLTRLKSFGLSLSAITFAPVIFKTNLSEA